MQVLNYYYCIIFREYFKVILGYYIYRQHPQLIIYDKNNYIYVI